MNVPSDLRYTDDHEWVRFEDNIATVGITDFAQGELGDVIFVELPEVDQEVTKDDPFGTIEAVKTVADLNSPIDGKVIEINEDIEDSPESVNEDCYGKGWLVKIKVEDNEAFENLMSPEDYQSLVE